MVVIIAHAKQGSWKVGFRSTSNDKVFEIKSFMNCNTCNVVYLITCTKCATQYIRHTTGWLRDRLRDHMYDTVKKHDANIVRHFNEAHGDNIMFIRIQAIEKVYTSRRGGDAFRLLCKCKVHWIFHLKTRIPEGLNFEWHRTHFYE